MSTPASVTPVVKAQAYWAGKQTWQAKKLFKGPETSKEHQVDKAHIFNNRIYTV
jgi:hypothetical protein